MATFNINIDPIPPAWYYETFYLFPHDSCETLVNQEFSVGLFQRGENAADTWVFSGVDHPYQNDNKYLKITNMYSTHPTTFYMEYNGVPIPNGSFDPDNPQVVIDVQFVPAGYPIPGLKFKFSGHDPDDGGNISFQVSMERVSDGVEGLWVYPRFNSQNLVCEPDPVQEIFQVSGYTDSCGSYGTWTVTVPNGSTRYVEIISNDAFGTTSASQTISVDTDFDIEVLGEITGPYNNFSNCTLRTKLNAASNQIIDSVTIARAHSGSYC